MPKKIDSSTESSALLEARKEFISRIDFHFVVGTEPMMGQKNRSWSNALIADKMGINPSTPSGWRNGMTFPTPSNFALLLTLFFGNEFHSSADAVRLIELYNLASPYHFHTETSLPDEESLQQIPAAFRFGISKNKIDALPETPQSIDNDISSDLLTELKSKVFHLIQRLKGSNSDPFACSCFERLFEKLDVDFLDVRPGVVLSRMRSVEAVRDGFDTEEGKGLLFPGAIAEINSVCSTGQDFLATFPLIREIERQRLALDIEKSPETIAEIQSKTSLIIEAASRSEAVAVGAVNALSENEVDIAQSVDLTTTADLVADQLLITRNFTSEVVRSILHNGAEAWNIIKPDLQDGAKTAARILPPLAVIALITSIAGPIAGLAGILNTDIFRSVAAAIPRVQRTSKILPKEKRKHED